MIDPLVRPIDPDDAADVAQIRLLEREARDAVTDQRGGARWLLEHPEVAGRWQAVIDDDRNDVLVAHIDDVVVGYIVGVLGDDDVIRIDQVWVTPEARECGFGDELLARTISRAVRRGATAVEGQALPGDRHTKNLYERAGIVARLITTFRSLAD